MTRRFGWLLIATALAAALASACRPDPASSPEGASLERGGRAFLAQCAVCHGPEGRGDGPLATSITAERRLAPAVLDSARVVLLGRTGVMRAMEGEAHRRAGSSMPLWGPHLGPEWMEPIADFVALIPAMGDSGRGAIARYLSAPEGTPSSGRRTYVLYCSACHGPQGGGDGFFSARTDFAVPRISGDALRAADDDQIARLIAAGGAHAQKAPAMPGWLYTISPDDRAALVAYLRALPGLAAGD
jgi:mono/diheme cytochrome c family protein